jgi:hypothetical protein
VNAFVSQLVAGPAGLLGQLAAGPNLRRRVELKRVEGERIDAPTLRRGAHPQCGKPHDSA